MTTTLSTYEQQAIDFLNATNTKFSAEFLRFDKYFDGDKEKRNIFKITLKNDRHTYSFEFGSSLQDSLENCSDILHDDSIDFYCGFKFEGLKHKYLSYSETIPIYKIKEVYSNNIRLKGLVNKDKATKIYNEFIKSNKSKYSNVNIFPVQRFISEIEQRLIQKATELKAKNFGEAIEAKEKIAPTAYDVLASVTKYEVGSFEDFCNTEN